MYYCEICQQLASPGLPSYRIVAVTRPAKYPCRLNAQRNPKAHRHRGVPKILTPGEVRIRLKEVDGKHDPTDDSGGHGYEIAKELTVCAPPAPPPGALAILRSARRIIPSVNSAGN